MVTTVAKNKKSDFSITYEFGSRCCTIHDILTEQKLGKLIRALRSASADISEIKIHTTSYRMGCDRSSPREHMKTYTRQLGDEIGDGIETCSWRQLVEKLENALERRWKVPFSITLNDKTTVPAILKFIRPSSVPALPGSVPFVPKAHQLMRLQFTPG